MESGYTSSPMLLYDALMNQAEFDWNYGTQQCASDTIGKLLNLLTSESFEKSKTSGNLQVEKLMSQIRMDVVLITLYFQFD